MERARAEWEGERVREREHDRVLAAAVLEEMSVGLRGRVEEMSDVVGQVEGVVAALLERRQQRRAAAAAAAEEAELWRRRVSSKEMAGNPDGGQQVAGKPNAGGSAGAGAAVEPAACEGTALVGQSAAAAVVARGADSSECNECNDPELMSSQLLEEVQREREQLRETLLELAKTRGALPGDVAAGDQVLLLLCACACICIRPHALIVLSISCTGEVTAARAPAGGTVRVHLVRGAG